MPDPSRARPGRSPAARGGQVLLGLAVALLGLLAGCGASGDVHVQRVGPDPAPAPTATVPGSVVPAAPLEVSGPVAAALGEAAADSGLVRWEGPTVTVATAGAPTARDREVLDEALAALGPATGLELERTEGDAADITVGFAPRSAWPAQPEAASGHVLGVTQARWGGGGDLRSADVWIDSGIGQAARNQTIVHELLHALGLGHVGCPTSLVYGGPDGAPAWELGALDRQLVATWYAPELPTGASADEVAAELVVVGDGPACAPAALEAAETESGTIWCERRAGSMPCVLVDGLGPEPVPPLAADRWTLDGVVYDHDPERYEAFTFEGRRLLCERVGGERRPCQFTDGPGPLTQFDAWTDGDLVYDEP